MPKQATEFIVPAVQGSNIFAKVVRTVRGPANVRKQILSGELVFDLQKNRFVCIPSVRRTKEGKVSTTKDGKPRSDRKKWSGEVPEGAQVHTHESWLSVGKKDKPAEAAP